MAARADAQLADLRAERERLVLLFSKGKIREEDFDHLVEPVDAALATIVDTSEVIDLPRINWKWETADVNRLLRRPIDHVVLGPDLRPVDVAWRGRIAEWAS